MDVNRPGNSNQTAPSPTLSNGYILPMGKLTPNALFVGGIDMKAEENEMRDVFARYGAVKSVKIITYRGGMCKGYGFVYFNEDVDIQPIIEQQILFKGRKLKLGPAIMKERTFRSLPSRQVSPAPWMSPTQYMYCAYCSLMGGGMAPASPILGGGSPYNQPYSYSNFGGPMVPQMPVNYPQQNLYAYPCTPPHWMADQGTQPFNQSFVDCGVQTADCAVVHSY